MNPFKSRKVQAAVAAFLASLFVWFALWMGFPITEEQAMQLGTQAVALAVAYMATVAHEDAAKIGAGTHPSSVPPPALPSGADEPDSG